MKVRLDLRSLAISLMIVFVFAVSAWSQNYSFSNAAPMTIPTSGAASVYPSQITVPGFCCGFRITKVTVTVNGLGHTRADDIGLLLVAPGRQKIKLMTDSGGDANVTGINLTFDDAAANSVADNGPLATGTFRPSSGTTGPSNGNDHPADFTSPAPVGPYSLHLSDLIETDPAGVWSLYVDDDTGPNGVGAITGGWTITFNVGTVFTKANPITIPGTGSIFGKINRISLLGADSLVPAPASPYPSFVTITGVSQVVTKVTVKINGFAFPRWDDIGILLVGPLGQKVRLSSDNGGALPANGDYIFDDSAASGISDTGAVAPNAGTYKPSGDGTTDDGGSLSMPADFPGPAPTGPYATTLSVFNGLDPNGIWTLYFFDDTGVATGSVAGGWSLIFEALAPTAAPISIEGRVRTSDGAGISRATVTLSGNGEPISVVTNSFGYYHLNGLLPARTYAISVSAKKYQFGAPVQVLSPLDDVANVDFIALPQ